MDSNLEIDRTFRRLKRVDRNSIEAIVKKWGYDGDDKRKLPELLEDHSWTIEEFEVEFGYLISSISPVWR